MPRPPTGSGAKKLQDYRARESGRAIAPARPRPDSSVRSDQQQVHGRPGRPSSTPHREQASAAELQPSNTRHQAGQRSLVADHSTSEDVILEETAMNSNAPSSMRLVNLLTESGAYEPAVASVNLLATWRESLPMLKSRVANSCGYLWELYDNAYPLRTPENDFPVWAVGWARNVNVIANLESNPQDRVLLPLVIIVEPENDLSIQDISLDLRSAVAIFQPSMPGARVNSHGVGGSTTPGASNTRSEFGIGPRRMTRRHTSQYRHVPSNVAGGRRRAQVPTDVMGREMVPRPASARPVGNMVYNPALLRQFQNSIPDWQVNGNRYLEEEDEDEE